jgi:hypothetical protein
MADGAIELSDGDRVTLADVGNRDDNILLRAASAEAQRKLYQQLGDQRGTMENLVRHHLRVSHRDRCVVTAESQWIPGNFNICVPIQVELAADHATRRLYIFRCPMPHKLSESRFPGTVDEKMESEVGAYVWMQAKCPEIRIPRLYGFGFTDGRCVCSLATPVFTG